MKIGDYGEVVSVELSALKRAVPILPSHLKAERERERQGRGDSRGTCSTYGALDWCLGAGRHEDLDRVVAVSDGALVK
jgi:hypothetical protein